MKLIIFLKDYIIIYIIMKNLFIASICLFLLNSAQAEWTQITTPSGQYVHSIAYSGSNLLCGTNTGLYLSSDMGGNWRYISNGINFQVITLFFKFGQKLFAGTSNGIYFSTDNGEEWSVISGSGDAQHFAISGNDIYKSNESYLYRSSDSGVSWQLINAPGYKIISLGAKDNNLFVQTTNNPVSFSDFYSSTNKGITWTHFNAHPLYYCFATIGEKVFSGTVNGLYITSDNGTSWNYSNNFTNHTIYSIEAKDNILFAGTDHGFFISRDLGSSWIDRSQGLNSESFITYLSVWDNYAFTNLYSHGLWKREISDITGIQNISNQIPEKYSLSQNFPNPFNPSTKISFALPINSIVKLKVYNSIGKEVANLVNENLNAGTYQYEFNAENLSSGIYFYTLETSQFTETKKMLLIK
ncbi:hypothetical protein BH10BAC5_BH10BAC5_18920 [soil metagenome]